MSKLKIATTWLKDATAWLKATPLDFKKFKRALLPLPKDKREFLLRYADLTVAMAGHISDDRLADIVFQGRYKWVKILKSKLSKHNQHILDNSDLSSSIQSKNRELEQLKHELQAMSIELKKATAVHLTDEEKEQLSAERKQFVANQEALAKARYLKLWTPFFSKYGGLLGASGEYEGEFKTLLPQSPMGVITWAVCNLQMWDYTTHTNLFKVTEPELATVAYHATRKVEPIENMEGFKVRVVASKVYPDDITPESITETIIDLNGADSLSGTRSLLDAEDDEK